MSTRTVICFDTSTINKLEDDGSLSEPMMAALASGFYSRLTAMCLDEILSTPKPERRDALFARCARLLSSGECIWPPHVIIQMLVSAHFNDPARFEWGRIDMRAPAYGSSIIGRETPTDLSAVQRQEQSNLQDRFEKLWAGLRPKLDAIFAKEPQKRPQNLAETLAIIRADGGLLWGFGQRLYETVTNSRPSEADIKLFMNACPPFRAAVYGWLVLGSYDRCIRLPGAGPSYGANRNELMMSVYLPYCHRFVSAERYRTQERCLREVAAAAAIDCEVLSYEDFCAGFAVTPLSGILSGERPTSLRVIERSWGGDSTGAVARRLFPAEPSRRAVQERRL